MPLVTQIAQDAAVFAQQHITRAPILHGLYQYVISSVKQLLYRIKATLDTRFVYSLLRLHKQCFANINDIRISYKAVCTLFCTNHYMSLIVASGHLRLYNNE